MAKNALMSWDVSRYVLFVFLLGKTIRYISYFGFLYFIVRASNGLMGYSQNEALFITVTFVFVDTLCQFFFRSVYTFRNSIVTGDFDLVLIKPLNSLFRSLFGAPDPIDFVTIPPILLLLIWIGFSLQPSLLHISYYILLILNSILIYAAFHIFVIGTSLITLDVDHLIEVFRDLSSMGRFPSDIYTGLLRTVLTFIIPIGIMYTQPAKALIGLLNFSSILGILAVGLIFFVFSLKFWNFALKRYTSASS